MADNIIELVAELNPDESFRRIQDAISRLQERLGREQGLNLNINPVINTSNISANNIQTAVQQAVSTPVDVNVGARINVQGVNVQSVLQLQSALESSGFSDEVIRGFISRLEELKVTVTDMIPNFVRLADGQERLNSVTIKGVDSHGRMVNYIERYNARTGEYERSNLRVTESLAKVSKEEKKVADEAKAQAQEQQKLEAIQTKLVDSQGKLTLYSRQIGDNQALRQQYEDIQRMISAFDNTAPLQNQRTEIVRIQRALGVLKTDIDNVRKAAEASANTPIVKSDIYKDISAFGTTGERLSSTAISEIAKAQIQSEIAAEDKVTRISKAAEDASGSLQKFFVQVERGDKSVETLTYQLNNQGNAFEYLGKTIREADNSTSAFKKVNLADQWKKQEQDLNKFVSDVGKANIANKQLAEGIADLQARIAKGGDTNAMSDYIDKFNLVQASFRALKAESGRINAFNQLDASIRKASASLNAYAAKNQKAVTSTKLMADGTTTFAQRWAELNRQLNQPNLTSAQFREINTQVAEFKKQAESAGLASKSLLTGMQSQLTSVISRWFSLYGAIRIVRSITEEIKTLDDAMISLRRVTEATDEEFAKFRKNAIGIAKEYGAAVSEVIDATATFSRSGFSLAESEELGRVATLYQNIGEGIGIEDASKTIVSVMKAFNVEAKDAETIIDKIINTANKASIDPEGLGTSLQKTSAALVAANNTLDESIALITTANEIVQNPESVA